MIPRTMPLARAGGAAVAALTATLAVCLTAGAVPAWADDAVMPLPESNLALLDRALVSAARQLVLEAPIRSGERLAIRPYESRAIDRDVERALLAALTAERVETWTLPPVDMPGDTTAALGTKAEREPGLSPDLASAEAARRRLLGLDDANADGGSIGAGRPRAAHAAAPPGLPVLTFRVEEARIDYPRVFRSGILGEQHVERRALGRVSARLLRPESGAVYWVGSADTTFTDIVARSDLSVLEHPTRAESRGQVPQQNWTKVAEPALVVALVVGLVSLFFTNRP